jgi:thioredoxin 1
MSRGMRITIVLLVVATAVTIMAIKDSRKNDASLSGTETTLPRLVDLGSDKCAQCKMMTPILDDLGKEYAGRMTVEFIDVRKVEGAAKQYGIDVIPTQIFFAADGTELYRHVGFYSGQEIMAKWAKLGVEF